MKFLNGQAYAREGFKEMESALLVLSDPAQIKFGGNEIAKSKVYNSVHKKLVKLRKEFNKLDEIREIF